MTANRRLHPRLYDADYLALTSLRDALRPVLAECAGTVVDYGCGGKPYRDLCPRAERYVGADLEVADPQDLKLLPGGRIPLPDGSADVVVSFQVLEHVDDVSTYLSECNRVLKPGGRLVLTTHGVWVYHPMAGVCEDYWRWTGAGLRRAVESHGFERARLSGACAGWRGTWQLFLVSLGGAFPHPSRPVRLAKQAVCLAVNGLCALFTRPTRDPAGGDSANGQGPTAPGEPVPICYVLEAWKNG